MSIVRDSAIVAIDSSVVVIVIVLSGALITRYKVTLKKILDSHSSDGLSKMILNLLLPALLFTEMLKNLDLEKLDQFGMLFFFCASNFQAVHTLGGCLLGFILARMTKASPEMEKLIMTCIGFQDTTAIPLMFAHVMATSDITADEPNFQEDAVDFILIYTVFVTVFKWSVAYK
jgi:predicted permease